MKYHNSRKILLPKNIKHCKTCTHNSAALLTTAVCTHVGLAVPYEEIAVMALLVEQGIALSPSDDSVVPRFAHQVRSVR